MGRTLDEIIADYEETRQAFRNSIKKDTVNVESLLEYQARFNDLKADIRPHKKELTLRWVRRDDKAATAIKFRIAASISNGEHDMYEKCSITQAEKYASGSKEYQTFIDQRGMYRAGLSNVSDLREDITSYINEIKDRLKSNG